MMPRFIWLWVMIWIFASGASHLGQAAEPGTAGAQVAEKEGVIVGHALPRAGGGWYGLIVDGGRVRLNYYDEKKKPTLAAHLRAVLRVKPPGRNADRDVMLPSGDGLSLVANRPVSPPWLFTVSITLIQPDESVGDTVVFNYNHSEVIANAAKVAP